jgi:hypothetical protein
MKKPVFSSRKGQSKDLLCMNSNPEESKWGYVAPKGGCEEIVRNVDENTDKALCWRCTQKITNSKMV